MKTVGEILREKRAELNLSLQEVQKQTKISQYYLKAIEENRFEVISSTATAKGFIRNYAAFLELSPENLLAIFRRDFDSTKTIAILPKLDTQINNNRQVRWTPRTTMFFIF